MTLVFFAYPIAAVMAHPSWPEVARGTLVPSLQRDPQYVFLLVGLIGTTITPYMQLFQQSSVVERGAARRHYGPERIDAWAGVIFSNLMSIFMIVATAATLHRAGLTHVETAADAAKALEPLVGRAAEHLFGVGLLGASLLAAAILPLATAYGVCEAFGFAKGIALDLRKGAAFYGLFTAFIVLGAAVALVPGLPVMRWLVAVQVLNGALLPLMLFFVLRLAGDRDLMGDLANTRVHRVLGWGTLVLVAAALTMMFGSQ
jgi:Mn2+/Fe2+ NRAMP family transporter